MLPEKELLLYETRAGKCPFEEWLEGLKDRKARYVIRARLDRLSYYGQAGKCEPVGEGVFELKIFYGPGYRVYFSEYGKTIILLLCGGDKGSQSIDIKKAKEYLADYRNRKEGR